jgi:hypothetical protein
MRETAAVKLRGDQMSDRVWLSVAGPTDMDERQEVERITLDIRAEDFDFLARVAAYRNALATLQGKRLKRKWTRKAMAEAFIAAQCDAMHQQLADMIAACGPLPEPEDTDAVEKYARKVLSWDKKNSG